MPKPSKQKLSQQPATQASQTGLRGRSQPFPLPSSQQVRQMIQVMEGNLPKPEEKEVESWLDEALDLAIEWGPKLLEFLPELVALL